VNEKQAYFPSRPLTSINLINIEIGNNGKREKVSKCRKMNYLKPHEKLVELRV
jgi:hypothetical protein